MMIFLFSITHGGGKCKQLLRLVLFSFCSYFVLSYVLTWPLACTLCVCVCSHVHYYFVEFFVCLLYKISMLCYDVVFGLYVFTKSVCSVLVSVPK